MQVQCTKNFLFKFQKKGQGNIKQISIKGHDTAVQLYLVLVKGFRLLKPVRNYPFDATCIVSQANFPFPKLPSR